jgi:hypothetical protein
MALAVYWNQLISALFLNVLHLHAKAVFIRTALPAQLLAIVRKQRHRTVKKC